MDKFYSHIKTSSSSDDIYMNNMISDGQSSVVVDIESDDLHRCGFESRQDSFMSE